MYKFFSFGGGVQSMAVLVMAARGEVRYDAFLFSNVGDDSENPATIEYYRKFAVPYAEKHRIKLIELHPKKTLYTHLMGDNRSIGIPAYLGGVGAPGNRSCTVDYKIKVIARYIRKNYTIKECVIGLGISTDEIHRARTGPSIVGVLTQNLEYPLINARMSRNNCRQLIQANNLPIPPKSSCWFCPFQTPASWAEMRSDDPSRFDQAVKLEKRLNEKRSAIGKDIVYLHRSLKPLNLAVGEQSNFFNDLDNCESGYCMT